MYETQILKTNLPPKYTTYTRDQDKFQVPYFLVSTFIHPELFTTYINRLFVCDLINNDLKPNEEKTKRAREEFIEKSPLVIYDSASSSLLVKTIKESFMYYKRQDMPEPSEIDYLVGNKALELFLKKHKLSPENSAKLSFRKPKEVNSGLKSDIQANLSLIKELLDL